ALHAEVVAVHVIDIPNAAGTPYYWVPAPSPEERESLREIAEREWGTALAAAGVPFQVVLMDGEPAAALIQAARTEDAALVVIGTRGLGGFKELLLGST